AIDEKPARTNWKIDGEFTEFRGENYILIRRAVIVQETTPTPPTVPNSPTVSNSPASKNP
ncbi:MAG: hypothetical protein LBC74_14170, partial [Planctomycetaceae bacterium]|nr:hypothetical protein [Planctomycetaceae bacterium]